MHSVCRCSLPVWRRSFLKKGTPLTYFGPALDPPLGGSGRKTTTLVRDHEYFIPTNFHQNPSSGSGEEVENVKSLWTGGRTDDDDGRTDDGRCAMTMAHSSLRLRWAKNGSKWPFSGKSFSDEEGGGRTRHPPSKTANEFCDECLCGKFPLQGVQKLFIYLIGRFRHVVSELTPRGIRVQQASS